MATQALVDEYKALGGTENVAALSDEEVSAKIQELLGFNFTPAVSSYEYITPETPDVGAVEQALASGQDIKPVGYVEPQKTPQAMTDAELMDYMLSPGAMSEFAATGAVDPALEEQQMRDLTSSRSFIENLSDPLTAGWVAQRMAKHAVAGTLNTFDLPAQAAGLYGLGSLGVEELANLINGEGDKPNFGSAEALDFANDRYLEMLNTLDVSPPRDVAESLSGIAGMMIPIPGPNKMNAAQNLLEVVTPFVIGGNAAPRTAVNFATAAAMDQGVREFADEAGDPYQTVFDIAGIGDTDNIEAMELAATAAAVTAPLWGPFAVRAFAQQYNPPMTIAAIADLDRLGPQNLYSITKNNDVLSGYIFSDTDAILEIARRAGVPNIDDLQKQFDTTTQSAATARVTEAVATGQMPTVHGNFNSPVSPRQLAEVYNILNPQQQIDVNNYMLMGNYIDIIRRRQAANIAKPTDAKELQDLLRMRAAMRDNIPMLSQFSQGYQQLTQEARRFISEGPYALIDKKTKAKFDREQPHYVPISLSSVDPADDLLKRMMDARKDKAVGEGGTPSWLNERDIAEIDMNTLALQEGSIPSIVGYTQSVLHSQLKNNAKGAYVDAMLQSNFNQQGKPLIRKADAKEIEKYPDRIVDIVRNGKNEHYITEGYIAKVLQLDPYILTNPLAMGLYASKRAFETGTTGVASVTFPFTSLIRDTISGWANTRAGTKAPGFGVITAPFEILGAKAMKSFYQAIDDRLAAGGSFLPGIDPNSQRQLSARIANTYQNTFYHLAQQFGGYDASIMRDRIQLARGELGELVKSIPQPISRTYGVSVKPLIAGLSAILDAMLEAPRYNAAKRATKSGSNIEEALAEARQMTGDTSKSGRAFTNQGQLITGDVVDPRMGVANPLIGWLAESSRNSIPYMNPMIKGLQRVGQAAAEDPVRFAMRNWLAVGLPAVAGYAWNAMMSKDSEEGYDYLDYQFNVRSSDEQIMEMYFGIPGLPPERGLSIPIAHESTPFMAPYNTFLHHMGSGGQEMQDAMIQTGIGIVQNAAGIGLPPSLAATINLGGISGIDTLIGGQGYQTREDNVGFLPQNVENAMRSQFGTQASIALEAISAFMDDKELSDGIDEYINSIAKRLPIVKGLGGWRTNTAYFTPIAADQRRKLDAYYKFDEAWSAFYKNEGLVVSPNSPPPKTFPDVDTGGELVVPFGGLGPQPTMRPVNPLYELYGQQIHDTLAKKDPYGFPQTKAQMGALTDQVRLLKGFNAGRADDYKELQEWLGTSGEKVEEATGAVAELKEQYDSLPRGTKTTTPEGRALKAQLEEAENNLYKLREWANTAKFLEDENIDLSNRFDVIRLTNLMEQRRVDLMKYQLSIIEQVENDLTKQLVAQGLMSPEDHFRFEKHLDPMANPALGAVQPPPPEPSAILQGGGL